MTPKQIFVDTVPPLIGYFGKSEVEYAAALIIMVCQIDDKFRPVLPMEVGVMMRDEPIGTFRKKLFANPFLFPDVEKLVKGGYAEFVGPPEAELTRPVKLTELGISKLEKYRK